LTHRVVEDIAAAGKDRQRAQGSREQEVKLAQFPDPLKST
jgi:hypothetical protein